MKNQLLFSALLLLISLMLVLSACERIDIGGTHETEETQTNAQDQTETQKPGSVFGTWYSQGNQTVIVITENLKNTTLYELKIGYYEYEKKISGSCTYEDYILTMTTDDGKTYSWVFDAKQGVLSANNGTDTSAYVRRDDLPVEHVEIPFPEFDKLNLEKHPSIGTLTGLTASSELAYTTAINIFQEYYQSTGKTPSTITDRVAQQGDLVNIDYKGYLGDIAFNGGSAESQTIALISSSGYIPGFAEGIIGKTAGSTFDVPVTFPDDYAATELAGKDVIFKMTLNKIYDLKIADVDIASYTKEKYATYQAMLDDRLLTNVKQDLWNQVLDASSCENIPEEAYGYFLSYYHDMYRYYAVYYGMEYEALLSYYQLTEERLLDIAKQDALQFIVAYEIAAKNDLTYQQADYQKMLNERVQELVDSGKYTQADAEAYIAATEDSMIRATLTCDTVVDWIYSQNAN